MGVTQFLPDGAISIITETCIGSSLARVHGKLPIL